MKTNLLKKLLSFILPLAIIPLLTVVVFYYIYLKQMVQNDLFEISKNTLMHISNDFEHKYTKDTNIQKYLDQSNFMTPELLILDKDMNLLASICDKCTTKELYSKYIKIIQKNKNTDIFHNSDKKLLFKPLFHKNNKIGTIIIDYKTTYNNKIAIVNQSFYYILFIILFIIFITIILTIVFSLNIIRPINILIEGIEKISQGDLSHTIENNSDNELGLLVDSFNTMAKKRKKAEDELKNLNETLEEKVYNRTKELEDQTIIAKDATKAKSSFLANMSHEIRTPLNAIMGFIDILKENEKNEKNIEYLNIVQNSSKLLLTIINDILDYSKIESGKLEIEYVKINPYKDFLNISNLFYQRAQEKNIKLETIIDPKLSKCIQIDPVRLSQVINNLLSNAIKFTENGGTVTYKIDYIEKSDSIFISIKDTGIGIKEEYQATIFNKFTQADSSITRKYGGTGLGLTISYNLVSLMGGKIKIKSKENIGSEFYFTIPLKKCNTCTVPNFKAIKSFSAVKSEEIKKQENKKYYILLVEDNHANQLFMKVILKKMEIKFDIASDGIEAIQKFKKDKYDAILMDENMPNMGGIEATKQILEYEKENDLIHTPIIALTANALKGDRERFLSAGMDEYLTKPVNKENLTQTLGKFL